MSEIKEVKTMEIKKIVCDFCGREWDGEHNSEEKYESSFIHIHRGSMLIPKKYVKKDSHALTLDGDYCNINCLTGKINSIRR